MSNQFRDDVLALVPSMRAYALVMTRSSADADDLVQDVLVRAWRYREGFQDGTNLKAWLFRILRNEFFSQLKRRPKGVGSLTDQEWNEPVCQPDQEWRRMYGDMLVGLSQLPEANRDALLLVAASGFSYEEAAAMTGCAIGTIKSRVSRAREKLAELLQYDLPVRRREAAHGLAGVGRHVGPVAC